MNRILRTNISHRSSLWAVESSKPKIHILSPILLLTDNFKFVRLITAVHSNLKRQWSLTMTSLWKARLGGTAMWLFASAATAQ